MKKLVNILIFCFCHSLIQAQWQDDFSDGDFEDNPAWHGNTGHFIVENGWLRLNAPAAGTSYLSTVSDIVADASWEFVFRMNFNPSASNYAKVYLVADQSVLTSSALNGYFLRLGSADDDICLFRQNGNVTEKLITGRAKTLDKATNHVRVLVMRDAQGYWTLKADHTGGRNFTLEGGARDNQIKTSDYFGVVCTYTATRTAGFYFGDFRVDGQPYTDIDPPVVTLCTAETKQISIRFSEPVVPVVPPYNNYFNINGSIFPANVIHNEPGTLVLQFEDGFACGVRHKLAIKGITDANGNVMHDTTLNISIPCRAEPHDIVINEIMANPSPSVRLPEHEYIELYNRSGKNIELEGWTFTYGNTTKTLPACLFPAGGYLLLVHPAAVADMAGYGATLPVLGSQTAIANSGQYLSLADKEETVISWVDFTTDWYGDSFKTGGGWSLEQIDPAQTCSRMSNWKASTGKNGGTPGIQNSVFAANPDRETPEIWRIAVPDSYTIILYLSKPLGMTLPATNQIVLSPAIPVRGLSLTGKHFNQLQLILQSPLQEGQWYDLSVSGQIHDCAGYEAVTTPFRFALPQDVDSLDVVINEILFQPVASGYPFIELYNRSDKAIRVSDLQLSLRDANGKLSTPVAFTDEPFLLLPGQYLVVSRDTDAIIQQFGATNSAAFLQMPGMPSLTKESGRIVLLSNSLRVIDEVHYNSKQHVDFLKISTGVSLERLHPDRNSLDPGNWHTAAQTAGFGTPGKRNSQYLEPGSAQVEVSVGSGVFSPDNDGVEDVLDISYAFDIPSLTAEVIIFDSAGRKIRQLVHRQILATNGSITWDGSDDSGRKALTGVYIVYFEVYHRDGFKKIFKIPCVLAGKRN